MPVAFARNAREFNIPNVTFISRAAPSIGSTENVVWQFTLAPNSPAAIHQLSREEIIVVLAGHAVVTLGDQIMKISKGDTIIVPPNINFGLANESKVDFEGVTVIPIGTQAKMGNEPPFIPPWAL